MKMSVDVRTRTDGEPAAFDPGRFFSDQLPAALEANHELVMPGAALLGLRPITIESGGDAWSLSWDSDRVVVQQGLAPGPLAPGSKTINWPGLSATSSRP